MLFEEIYWLGTEHPADFELRSELVSVGLKVHTISFDTLLPHKDRIKRLVVDYSLLTEKTKLDELVKFQKKYQYRMVVLLPSGTINYEILNHLRIDSYLFESTNKLENLAQIKLWLKNLAKESDAFDEFNRSIYENFPFAIYEADDAGNYLYANKAGCELLGYTKKELLRLSIKDVSSEKKLNLELYESFKKVGKMSDYVYLKTKQGKIVLIQ
ncbi:PAS domain S-box protein, partial [bacterium]